MECREAERLFDLYLDREIGVGDSRALHRHLADCRRCNDNWMATRKAVDLLAGLPRQRPDPEIHARIIMSLPGGGAGRRPLFRSFNWQTAAVFALVFTVAGTAFLSGERQMAASAVQSRDGHTVVVPRPGRPLIIPPGATVTGDLRVDGDVYLQGGVNGKITVTGRVVKKERGWWDRIRRVFLKR
jgi:anti-sigma factor RsiW